MFCTCSRICSMSTFMSTAARVVSMSWDFEDRVFASRLSSCIRKSSRRPGGLLAVEGLAHLFDVAAQAIDFFVHIEALREDGHFLLDAVLIDRPGELRDALQELGAMRARTSGSRSATRAENSISPSQRCSKASRRRAPSLSRERGELVQGFVQQRARGREQRRHVARRIANHAGPAQQFEHDDARRGACLSSHLPRRVEVKHASSSGSISSAPDAVGGPEVQRALDLAAPHGGGNALAKFGFGAREIPPAAAAHFEEAVIDGFQFPGQQCPRGTGARAGQSRSCYES